MSVQICRWKETKMNNFWALFSRLRLFLDIETFFSRSRLFSRDWDFFSRSRLFSRDWDPCQRLLARWWKKWYKVLICYNLEDIGMEIIHCIVFPKVVFPTDQNPKVWAHSSLTPHRRRLVCAPDPLVDHRRPRSPHIHRGHQSIAFHSSVWIFGYLWKNIHSQISDSGGWPRIQCHYL